ncbi:hypothetical protein ACGFNU_38130 [Spirillospora sp. NPDC048911]|uniref:hypothetical protein n=1 Tax=Spirillospora sp. NPDC048911 TaxID=3364527 RepID=UPI003720614A
MAVMDCWYEAAQMPPLPSPDRVLTTSFGNRYEARARRDNGGNKNAMNSHMKVTSIV